MNTNVVLVKLIRRENNVDNESASVPIELNAGPENSDLNLLYKTIWDHFIELERDLEGRKNLSVGAGPRASDGIEGLSVDWCLARADSWPKEKTAITKNNLALVWQKLQQNLNAVIHCNIKARSDGGIEYNPQAP